MKSKKGTERDIPHPGPLHEELEVNRCARPLADRRKQGRAKESSERKPTNQLDQLPMRERRIKKTQERIPSMLRESGPLPPIHRPTNQSHRPKTRTMRLRLRFNKDERIESDEYHAWYCGQQRKNE